MTMEDKASSSSKEEDLIERNIFENLEHMESINTTEPRRRARRNSAYSNNYPELDKEQSEAVDQAVNDMTGSPAKTTIGNYIL